MVVGSIKRRLSIDEDRPFDRLVDALGLSAINIPPFIPPPPPPPPTQPTDKAALFESRCCPTSRNQSSDSGRYYATSDTNSSKAKKL